MEERGRRILVLVLVRGLRETAFFALLIFEFEGRRLTDPSCCRGLYSCLDI